MWATRMRWGEGGEGELKLQIDKSPTTLPPTLILYFFPPVSPYPLRWPAVCTRKRNGITLL